jgi:hypothetical protein
MKKLIALVIMVSLLAAFFAGCKVQPAPGSIAGTISWQSQGGNIALAFVTVNVWGNGNAKVASAVSDKDGHYTIANIPAGEGYLVTCHQSPGDNVVEKSWMFQNIPIKSKSTTQIDMTYDNAIKGAVLPPIYQ